ncbi:MAG: hypothetical protein ACRDTG_23215 [Pseudonocardiaceae bacterium]
MFWINERKPSYDPFGITATDQGQHVWFDHPESTRHWPLDGVEL